MIDLHIHTTYSDGADTVIEVLKNAEKLKLEYISITDHDNCNVYKELESLNIKDYFSGKIIPGIEIKCAYKGRLMEFLGYKINPKKMQVWADEYYKNKTRSMVQQKYFDMTYDNCIKHGFYLDKKENIKFDANKDWATVIMYKELIKDERNRKIGEPDLLIDFNNFSKKYCGNPGHFLYIDKSKDYPTVEETINAIKSSDGLVFLPHVFIYRWAEDRKKFLEEILSNYKVDGIECMHSEFSGEEIDYLLDFCDKNNYYKSGGSDYHGKNKVGIELAVGKGNLKISKGLIEDWAE